MNGLPFAGDGSYRSVGDAEGCGHRGLAAGAETEHEAPAGLELRADRRPRHHEWMPGPEDDRGGAHGVDNCAAAGQVGQVTLVGVTLRNAWQVADPDGVDELVCAPPVDEPVLVAVEWSSRRRGQHPEDRRDARPGHAGG
jgi:hypothetical protein